MRSLIPFLCGRLWPAILFGGLVVLGLRISGDYGLCYDEFTNHCFGVSWYKYAQGILVDHAPIVPLANLTQHDIVHGPVIEMALAWIEDAVLKLTDLRQIVFFRHGATWVIFCLGVACFYFLARRLFKGRAWALLAGVFLVIHPRIFSHAFYDSVDIPFLSLYVCSLCTLFHYVDRKTVGSLFLHAVSCAVLIDVRSMGVVIPAITLAVLALDDWPQKETANHVVRLLGRIAIFLTVLALTTVLFWPYLWTNPFLRALDVIRETPRVAWGGSVLYLGQTLPATQLPWHYIPVWILITTPIAYSGLFFIGLFDVVRAFFRNPAACYRERVKELVVMAAFFLPLLLVILLRAVVFDSWRHLFFVYPAFVLMAIGGLRRTIAWIDAWQKERARRIARGIAATLIATNIAMVGWFMIRNHPYEHVYFNRIGGRDLAQIKRRFEMDYWGLSYRKALEQLMARDRGNPVAIYHENAGLLAVNGYILAPADQARILPAGLDQAKYVITTFRWARDGYPSLVEDFSIKVDGEKILCVYRKK
jgi:4-amino-4-deoxy-L-arabinose transferase-like glycosyltransferase